jgi:formiminotetrahydrofolate cyclodeaminase
MTDRNDAVPADKGSLLDRRAADLLDLFAAGKNTPGAGSAAALAGAVAGSLLQAVARYSIRDAAKRGSADSFGEKAGILLDEVRETSSRLSAAVEADAAAFERFWRLRAGGGTEGERQKAFQKVVEVPLEIAEQCAALAEMGIEFHEHGFKPAQGEASTAVLLAVAGGEAALNIVRLNLKLGGTAGWAEAHEAPSGIERRLRDLRRRIEERMQA